jgi:3',5'-cyclic AMP phosphodiesterase CpdA
MDLTLALISDLHFGPEASFGGKLRKLTAHAGGLARAFVARMNAAVKPDLVVNLGDDIEDESHAADLGRYTAAMGVLLGCDAELVNVAGNHDLIHLGAPDLLRAWGRDPAGALYHSFDRRGVHVIALHTHEEKDVEVSIDEAQLAWLAADLREHRGPTVVLMHHSAAEQDLRGNRWFEGSPHICLVRERRALRAMFEAHGEVRAVFNGHLHWNHLDVIRGIPYVTVQSLIENLDDDAPGRAAAAYAVARLTDDRLLVEIEGAERVRYQIER